MLIRWRECFRNYAGEEVTGEWSRTRFEEFFNLGIGRDGTVVSGQRKPLGYQQLTLTGSAQKLTIPAAVASFPTTYAVIICIGAASTDFGNWRDDGTAPTNAVGMPLFHGQELDYSGDITALQFIVGAGSPVLNISYYN